MTNGEQLKQHINSMSYRELYIAFTDFKGSEFIRSFCIEHCNAPKSMEACSEKCIDRFEQWCNSEL